MAEETPTDLLRASDSSNATDISGDESADDSRATKGKSHAKRKAKVTFADGGMNGNLSKPIKELSGEEKQILAKGDTLGDSASETDMALNPKATEEKEVGLKIKKNYDNNVEEVHTDLNLCETRKAEKDMSGDSNGNQTFEYRAATEFDQMFKGMQIWCRFQAEMHLMEAAWFESRCFVLEITAAILSTLSLTSIVAFMVHWIPGGDDTDSMWKRLGIIGFIGVAIAGFLQFVGKGSAKLLPTFHKKADEHRKSAYSWQHLKHDIKLIRLQLRDPERDVREASTEYTQFVVRRMQLSEMILVSSKTATQMDSRDDRNDILTHELQFLLGWKIPDNKQSARVGGFVETHETIDYSDSEDGLDDSVRRSFIETDASTNSNADRYCYRLETSMRKRQRIK